MVMGMRERSSSAAHRMQVAPYSMSSRIGSTRIGARTICYKSVCYIPWVKNAETPRICISWQGCRRRSEIRTAAGPFPVITSPAWKRIVSPAHLEDIAKRLSAGDAGDYRDYPVRFAVSDGVQELTKMLPVILRV